jgi:murein DD-endopeptidase MepM/ murein hydrolase activator NlpD
MGGGRNGRAAKEDVMAKSDRRTATREGARARKAAREAAEATGQAAAALFRDRWQAAAAALAAAETQVGRQVQALMKEKHLTGRDASAALREARKRLEKERKKAGRELEARLGALQARAAKQRDAMAARAETMYKQGPTGGITTLLEAVNPQDALRRSAYADVISRTEQRTIETVTVAHTAVEAQRLKLKTEEDSLARVLQEQRTLLAEVQRLRDDKALAVAAADAQIAQLETHLEAEDRQVAAITRGSDSRGSSVAPAPKAARGGWVWPARGPVTSGYGARWGRMHRGLDIGAPTGAAIVAAKSGVVTMAGSMSGYGRVVIINHGGGYSSLYAHQSSIAVRSGQRVGAGQRIGSVGCSGSCTGPHLHFEIRVNGAARNPRNYL